MKFKVQIEQNIHNLFNYQDSFSTVQYDGFWFLQE